MFDVKKLANLLKEIFTRDNENFSPELVAIELKSRACDFVETECDAVPYTYTWPNEVEMKAVSFSGVAKVLDAAKQELINDGKQGQPEVRATLDVTKGYNRNDPSTWRPSAMMQILKEHTEWPWRTDSVLLRNIDGVWKTASVSLGVIIQNQNGSYDLWGDGITITKQDFIDARDTTPTPRFVVIGNFSQCTHNNSVVIGNNQKSDKPNQLKIGNNDISVSRDITDEEFQEILATFKSVREDLPK